MENNRTAPRLTTLCYAEREDAYLMLHRVKKVNDVNKDKWIGIGGHFEAGESAVGPKTGEDGLAEEGLAARATGEEICRSDFVFTHRIWHMCAWEYDMEKTEIRAPYRLVDADELAALPVASVMGPYRKIALEKLGR